MLTDAVEFGTDSTGSHNLDIWRTRPQGTGGSNEYYLWVTLVSVPSGVTTGDLNSGTNPVISQSLTTPGTYNFNIYGNPGSDLQYYGLNLFFGGSQAPAISVFAPLATTTGIPGFQADSGLTLAPTSTNTPGSGTLSAALNGQTITLTNYRWESSMLRNQSVVSPYQRTPSGTASNQGSFTLVVSGAAAPEASPFALLALGGFALGIVAGRRRGAVR